MQIRKVTPHDEKELTKLLIEFYNLTQSKVSKEQAKIRAYKDIKKTSEETSKSYITQLENIVFVADENGSLKGFISGEIKETAYRIYDLAGLVKKWFVEENYQNKGVGKELFDKLVEEFKKADCTHIELDTHIENEKAIEIYESMGFKKRLVTFFKPLKNLH